MSRMLDEWLALDSHERSGTDALMVGVGEIEGVEPVQVEMLAKSGIRTAMDLWMASPVYVSNKSGIASNKILGWQQTADLMRLDGVGPEYAALLVAAGVKTTRELAELEIDELQDKVTRVIERRPSLVKRAPTKKAMKGWILAALTVVYPGAPLRIPIVEPEYPRGW